MDRVVGAIEALEIALNALKPTNLSISIGLGIESSVRAVHRIVEEYHRRGNTHESLLVTLGETGGASMVGVLTTAGSPLWRRPR